MTFYLKIYFEIKLIYNTFRVCILIVLFFFGLSCNQQKPVNLDVGNANSVQHQEPTLLLKYTIEDADWIVKNKYLIQKYPDSLFGMVIKVENFLYDTIISVNTSNTIAYFQNGDSVKLSLFQHFGTDSSKILIKNNKGKSLDVHPWRAFKGTVATNSDWELTSIHGLFESIGEKKDSTGMFPFPTWNLYNHLSVEYHLLKGGNISFGLLFFIRNGLRPIQVRIGEKFIKVNESNILKK